MILKILGATIFGVILAVTAFTFYFCKIVSKEARKGEVSPSNPKGTLAM